MASQKRTNRHRIRRQAFASTIEKCCDKVTYSSKGTALAALDGMASLHKKQYQAYRCAAGSWHLTTNIRGTIKG